VVLDQLGQPNNGIAVSTCGASQHQFAKPLQLRSTATTCLRLASIIWCTVLFVSMDLTISLQQTQGYIVLTTVLSTLTTKHCNAQCLRLPYTDTLCRYTQKLDHLSNSLRSLARNSAVQIFLQTGGSAAGTLELLQHVGVRTFFPASYSLFY
jgi:predicted secreted protein